MTTIWRDTGPEGWNVPTVVDVTAEFGNPGSDEVVLMYGGGGLPDRVRQPAELGGRELRVLQRTTATTKCPACAADGEKPALELEEGFGVTFCEGCRQYIWFRWQEKEEGTS